MSNRFRLVHRTDPENQNPTQTLIATYLISEGKLQAWCGKEGSCYTSYIHFYTFDFIFIDLFIDNILYFKHCIM